MNVTLLQALADDHIREVRRQAARRRIRALPSRSPAGRDDRQRLRCRLGFLLVEAGFRLLASTGSMPRD